MTQKPNLKPAILTFLEKKMNKILQDIGIGKNFLNSEYFSSVGNIPIDWQMRMCLINKFSSQQKILRRMNRQTTFGKKFVISYIYFK